MWLDLGDEADITFRLGRDQWTVRVAMEETVWGGTFSEEIVLRDSRLAELLRAQDQTGTGSYILVFLPGKGGKLVFSNSAWNRSKQLEIGAIVRDVRKRA